MSAKQTKSALTLTRTQIRAGVYEAVLQGGAPGVAPQLEVVHQDQALPDVTVTARADGWALRVPVPATLLSDGVQSFVIRALPDGARLDAFSIVTGVPLEDDIRAEVDLLRAELDILKKAFRSHCAQSRE